MKDEPEGSSTSHANASLDIFISENISWKKKNKKTKPHNIFHNQSSFDYFNIFIKFKAKFSCVFISCNYIFFYKA